VDAKTKRAVVTRHAVVERGRPDGPPMVFAHGYGCDQNMWRFVAPRFEDTHRVILFDHIGAGGSDLTAYDVERHATLEGYATDVLALLAALDLHDVVFVGHSVSAMIGVLAAVREPDRFGKLVLVGPSPRYTDDDAGYVGGFSERDIEEMLEALDSNFLGWSAAMGPAIMANADRPELGDELVASFCRTDPAIAKRFARATFTADNRADLAKVPVPALVLQCSDDVIAPVSVGRYVADQLPDAELVLLQATGHCPNLSAPDATAEAIRLFVSA
jgi:sigma-B regulation protein RsbQ